jgi:hypothetical protein
MHRLPGEQTDGSDPVTLVFLVLHGSEVTYADEALRELAIEVATGREEMDPIPGLLRAISREA